MALTKVHERMITGGIYNVASYSGNNAGEKIAAAIDDLPSTGGVIDARGLTGTQTIASDIFSSRSKPFVLMLGHATYEIDMSSHALSLRSNQHIEMYGTTFQPDQDGTTSTSSGQGFITPKTFQTTGSGTSGSAVVTFASTDGLEVGCLVAIDGAQGTSDSDTSTTLSSGISDSDTTIPLTDATYFNAGIYTIVIGSEIITGTGKSGSNLTGVTRGAYGTTAASHLSGATVTFSNYWRGTVESISGSSVTLSGNLTSTVTNAKILFGSTNMSITGTGIFNGRQDRSGSDPSSNVYGAYFELVTQSHIGDNITFKDWDHGGVSLVSSWYNYVGGSFFGNGRPGDSLGANIWLFRRCAFNVVSPTRITNSHAGIFIDDRTGTLNLMDGTCNKNVLECPFINTTNVNIGISGGNENVAYLGSLSSAARCIDIETNAQSATPRPADKNTIFAGHVNGGTTSVGDGEAENYVEVGSSNDAVSNSGSTSYISIKRGSASGEYFGTGVGTSRDTLVLNDGVTAPSASSGVAQMYVDTADGDLKIIFADGTVKTIVTDT